jgi:hypothetical protein
LVLVIPLLLGGCAHNVFDLMNPRPVVIDNFSRECTIRTISKKDTPQSQRWREQDNARCRAARAKKK